MPAAIQYSIFGHPEPGHIQAELLEDDRPVQIDGEASDRTSAAIWNGGPDAIEIFDGAGNHLRIGPIDGAFLMSPTGTALLVKLAT
jgi:hypothetical protein